MVHMSMRYSVHKSTKNSSSMIIYGHNLKSVSDAKFGSDVVNPIMIDIKSATYFDEKFAGETTHKIGEIVVIKKPRTTSLDPVTDIDTNDEGWTPSQYLH
ncbi:hypothetical protein RF11_03498 [Thelohanellus kitauei]|uniref:Uncharacterized protein n=1 Tax=Thelohanellus kitauei TaxID=669202 RepID=A0A0C2ME20_THEKT|nr:hypothetical protein RF11_03498 [Thelohanellus kitauei]